MVRYRWLRLCGRELTVVERVQLADGPVVRCRTSADVAVTLPAWMLDEATCARLTEGAPRASAEALLALRDLLLAAVPTPASIDLHQPGGGDQCASEKTRG